VYAPPSKRYAFYEMGVYSIVFYISHVVTIFVVANTIFWLKDIDPRFKTAEDNNYEDLPTVAALTKRKAEGGNFLLDNLKSELESFKEDIEDFGSDIKHKAEDLASGLVGGVTGRRRGSSAAPPARTSRDKGKGNEEGLSDDIESGSPPYSTGRGHLKVSTVEDTATVSTSSIGVINMPSSGLRSDRVSIKEVNEGSSSSHIVTSSPTSRTDKKKDNETSNPMFDFI
jgi:hypothetical protein